MGLLPPPTPFALGKLVWALQLPLLDPSSSVLAGPPSFCIITGPASVPMATDQEGGPGEAAAATAASLLCRSGKEEQPEKESQL